MSKTFDLSTLNLGGGTHKITVKARASGYNDSVESNSVQYVVGNKITFTINGTQYQAEAGMTWGEWVDSEYNLGGYYKSGADDAVLIKINGVTYCIVYEGVDAFTMQNVEIFENGAYTTHKYSHGGGTN